MKTQINKQKVEKIFNVANLSTQMKKLHLKKEPKLFSAKYNIKNTQKKISILFQKELNHKLNDLRKGNLVRYFKSLQDIEEQEIKAPSCSPIHYD